MGTITLTTDFGLKDPYVGIMKGVILSIDPAANIIDITHEIEPQDIREGAFLVEEYYRYFPPGTIHIAVVDPTVGSDRRPIILTREGHHFVGPDNGIFSLVADSTCQVRVIENRNFMLPTISCTFQGRDVFAPAAARLARGFSPYAFGREITDHVLLPGLHPLTDGNTLNAEVVRFDRFGNALTNIRADAFDAFVKGRPFEVRVGDLSFASICRSYYEDELTCLVGSAGYIEFGAFRGNFREKSGTKKNDPVTVRIP